MYRMPGIRAVPNPVNIISEEGQVVATYPVAGSAPRVKEIVVPYHNFLDNLLVNKVTYDEEVTDLPA